MNWTNYKVGTRMMNNTLQRNLLALTSSQSELGVRLSHTTLSSETVIKTAQRGARIPVVRKEGKELPLHSTVDPLREGERFYQAAPGGGYIICLGLGAGYHLLSYLQRSDVSGMLVIEFDIQMVKTILSQIDLRSILLDRRVRVLVDPQEGDIRRMLLENYLPAVSGNMQLIQLRSRISVNPRAFDSAREEVMATIGNLREDYSVQSYFGKRWYKNTLRNLRIAETSSQTLPPIRTALISAAGPSLEAQLPEIRRRRTTAVLIATDTSLPFLLRNRVVPDIVISIDCQHITYQHFLYRYPREVPLVLDLASPRQLTGLTDKLVFFTSGHPFSLYVGGHWRRFPHIDTTGGNVTHAAVSLADSLGARTMFLFGADYSFPGGKSYARGTYLYSFYDRLCRRTAPLETWFVHFLFRNAQVRKQPVRDGFRYTIPAMHTYKERLEQHAAKLQGELIPVPGQGEKIDVTSFRKGNNRNTISGQGNSIRKMFSAGSPECSWSTFLRRYDRLLSELPVPTESLAAYRSRLEAEHQDVVTPLFPACAAIRREREGKNESAEGADVLGEAIAWSRKMIANQLSSGK